MTAITVEEFRLVAVYQPVWQQGATSVEEYLHQVENQVSVSGRDEVMVIGGDHNAHVGGDAEWPQLAGRWGLRTTNEAGRDLLEWCEEHGWLMPTPSSGIVSEGPGSATSTRGGMNWTGS